MKKISENHSPEGTEALREVQIVINNTLGRTMKKNGFGINEIKFSILGEEHAQRGIQLNLQATGSAVAKNKIHISYMLQKLVRDSRE